MGQLEERHLSPLKVETSCETCGDIREEQERNEWREHLHTAPRITNIYVLGVRHKSGPLRIWLPWAMGPGLVMPDPEYTCPRGVSSWEANTLFSC